MFDSYGILSGGVYFSQDFGHPEDWLLEREEFAGTIVWMKIHNHTSRTIKKIFDQYTRVFAHQHPNIELASIHVNSNVKQMIGRVNGSSDNR